jgi:hypothetical protein
MGRMKRMRKRLKMKPPKRFTWAGEPNARELELDAKLAKLDAKHAAEGLTEAERVEGMRLHLDLLEESQRRSGVTLIKVARNADDTSATYDMSNFYRMVEDVQMLVAAGIPIENAVARAAEDERLRQQQEAAIFAQADNAQAERDSDEAITHKGFFQTVKRVFGGKGLWT